MYNMVLVIKVAKIIMEDLRKLGNVLGLGGSRRQRVNREVEPQGVSVRPMTPDDYVGFSDLAQSAWPNVQVNAEHDFVAITDHGVSLAAIDEQGMVGASYNLIKPSENPGEYHLLVHMLGTRQGQQGKGIGRKLMGENYKMVTSRELGNSVREVRLTSDPLEAKNVIFYLHHLGMHSGTYKIDPYKLLAESGADQQRGLPSDRFLYSCEPASGWVKNRQLPTQEAYEAVIARNPNAVLSIDTPLPRNFTNRAKRVIFVEMPESIVATKSVDMQRAREWRDFHRAACIEAFDYGYAAVDTVVLPAEQGSRHFIVLMRGFNERNPRVLTDAIARL